MSKKKKKNDTKKVEEIKEEKESTIEEVKTPEEEKMSTETVDEKHVQKHKYKHGFVHFILVLVFLISLVYFFTNLINTNSESKNYLKDTDWIVIRHRDQLALGQTTSLTNEQYLDLQHKLNNIEDELVHTRRIYNEEVTRYNTLIETVPSNIVASMFAFKKAELFQIDDDTRENVKIEL